MRVPETNLCVDKYALPQLPNNYTIQIQRRNYIFFPSTLSDASKMLNTLFDNNQLTHKRLMVKLQSRWQDTLFTYQERMKMLKQIKSKQHKLARKRALSVIERSAKYSTLVHNMHMRGSAKYSSFVKKMHTRMTGKLSSIANSNNRLSRGRHNLLSHYNAKKRVYARRKLTRQYARTMNGSRTLMERWKSRYWGGRRALLNGISSSSSKIINNTASDTTTQVITLTEPAQKAWFDNEGYPVTSRDPETGRFVNPWLSESSNGENGLVKFLRWKVGGALGRLVNTSDGSSCNHNNEKKTSTNANEHVATMRDKASTQRALTQPSVIDQGITQETIGLTWIGHSTTVVTFPGNFTILTDPHFSNYAGPVRRTKPPAFGVNDLPDIIDCVLISHDHMDHLDYWSILELIESNKVKFFVVPLGIKSWLISKAGVSPEDVIELEWWEGVRISKDPHNNNKPRVEGLVHAFDKVTGQRESEQPNRGLYDKHELVITCAPTQHWCSRTPFDRNRRLWCSFAVHATPALSQKSSRTHSFYFAGDTGLPPEFPLHHQIGDRLGPFDLSAIPIGAYEPEWFMKESHCNPVEAVKIHQAVRSRRSVAVHFDTFDLADEPSDEPPNLLMDEVRRVNDNIMAEVGAVADEVGIVAGIKQIKGKLASVADISDANEELIEILSPFVDFTVIKQGGRVESLQK